MRIPTLVVALILSCGTVSGAEERYYGYSLGTATAPPLVVVADHEPHVILVPHTQILKVADRQFDVLEDMFRFAGYWYVCKGGHWYRATGYRGPYNALDVRQVPQQVLIVPPKHWKRPPLDGSPMAAKRVSGSKKQVVVSTADVKAPRALGTAKAGKPIAVVASRNEARPVMAAVQSKREVSVVRKKGGAATKTVGASSASAKKATAAKTRDGRLAKQEPVAAKKKNAVAAKKKKDAVAAKKKKDAVVAKTNPVTEKKKAGGVKTGDSRTAKKQRSEASKKKEIRGRETNATIARKRGAHAATAVAPTRS